MQQLAFVALEVFISLNKILHEHLTTETIRTTKLLSALTNTLARTSQIITRASTTFFPLFSLFVFTFRHFSLRSFNKLTANF